MKERIKLYIPLGIFVVMAAFLWAGLGKDPSYLPSALIDRPMPNFELTVLKKSGEKELITPSTLAGEPYLLNVWATWCPSCLHEHPYFLKLAEQGVNIVGLNYKDEADKALDWLDRYGNPYSTVIYDPDGRLGLDLGVYGAPETFVVDASGTIRYKHVGVVNDKVWKSHLAPLMLE